MGIGAFYRQRESIAFTRGAGAASSRAAYHVHSTPRERASDRCTADRAQGRGGAFAPAPPGTAQRLRSEEHTSELQSLMRISYAVFCLKKKIHNNVTNCHPSYHTLL